MRLGFALIAFLWIPTAIADSFARISILSILQPKRMAITLLSPERATIAAAGSAIAIAAKERIEIELRQGQLSVTELNRNSPELRYCPGQSCAFLIEIPGKLQREYHGELTLRVVENAIDIVLRISQEELLSSITASEMGEYRNPEALKAFAVVARSFLKAGPRHPNLQADLCDTTHCEVFQAYKPAPEATKAVHDTIGLILTYRKAPFRPYYSRSCGGKTATYLETWGKASPDYPFESVSCPCRTEWTVRLSAAQLQSATGFPAVHVIQRDNRMEIAGIKRKASFSPEEFRTLIGRTSGWNLVKSNWFVTAQEGHDLVIRGKGLGHRVGLCQNGVFILASGGKTFLEILQYYFPNAEVRSQI